MPSDSNLISDHPISPDELERVERFIAAYNAIDDWIQRELDTQQSFRSAVDLFAKTHPWWRDAETLRTFAALRNFLIHEKLHAFDYPAVPGAGAVAQIEAIRDRLLAPANIGESFGREVMTLAPTDSLQSALEAMNKRGFRRFPVYRDRRCVGLLTERGIARYLAELVAKNQPFRADVAVERVLSRETKRTNLRFAAPQLPVMQIAFWFHENTFLETVLIADGGNDQGTLRGIITRGDVAGWSE